MLRISKKADYAVFLLGAIARQGAYPGGPASDTVVSAHEIARQARLNKSVVANLLKEFARHGLLESVRGLRGGYRLLKAPAAISLAEILEVVEGKFVLVDCVGHGEPGPAGPLLALAPSMKAHGGAAHARGDGPAAGVQAAGVQDCALMSFCPSKAPMRIVHDRISQLFATIHLDELCALPTTHQKARPASPSAATSPR